MTSNETTCPTCGALAVLWSDDWTASGECSADRRHNYFWEVA